MFFYYNFIIMEYLKIRMEDVLATLAVENRQQEDFMPKLKRVVERALENYCSNFSDVRARVFCIDPMTSSQISAYFAERLYEKVREEKSKWIGSIVLDKAQAEEVYGQWQEKFNRTARYQRMLKQAAWYHLEKRCELKKRRQKVLDECVPLRDLVNVAVYLSGRDGRDILSHLAN